jgi:hypothetical protein
VFQSDPEKKGGVIVFFQMVKLATDVKKIDTKSTNQPKLYKQNMKKLDLKSFVIVARDPGQHIRTPTHKHDIARIRKLFVVCC